MAEQKAPAKPSRAKASKQKKNCSKSDESAAGYIQPPDMPWYFEEDAGPGKIISEVFRSTEDKLITRNRKRITLLMLSGGIDSVYGLVKLLKESDDIVIAHHVHLINHEGRHQQEAKACEAIVEYCKREYRDFKYTQSLIDRRKFKAFGIDAITVACEAGIVVQSFYADTGSLVDRWTIGINAEDVAEFDPEDTDSHRTPSMLRAMEANCHPHKPPQLFNLPLRPKRDLMEYIGSELTGMCWTCRTPATSDNGEVSECGECHTCKIMAEIR